MKIAIFGTGYLYKKNKRKFENMRKIVFLDNDIEKWGTYIDGIKVVSPDNILDYELDYCIIASSFFEEMRRQLISIGFPEEKIIDKEHRDTFWNSFQEKYSYQIKDIKKGEKRILLISPNMGLTGAPLMLFNAACILNKNNYQVEVAAFLDGELVYEYLKEKIPVSIFNDFNFEKYDMTKFMQYDMVFINTLLLYSFAKELSKRKIPVFWWIHEEDYPYRYLHLEKNEIQEIPFLSIYGVGNRVIKAFEEKIGISIKNMLYGIEEPNEKMQIIPKEKLVFAVIGSVCKHKAQELFCHAVNEHWNIWKDEAEFWIIGDIVDKIDIINDKRVRLFGTLEHKELMRLYSNIDVVVCPSYHDSMPCVVSEAMMLQKTCIVSSAVGQADYMTSYVDGLTFKTGDKMALGECISWAINNRHELKQMGKNAYKIYQKYFQISKFEKELLKAVDEVITSGCKEYECKKCI